jgi:PAS domain S-box-containing protein
VLRLRESYLSAIIENQPGLLWLKDRDGKFLTVNSQFSNSCGLDTPESLIGKTDFDIWPHDLAVGYIADDAKVMETGKPCMVEEHISDKGEIRWFETFKTPIFNKQGIIIGTTGYSRDITERKRIEEELQRAQKLDSLGVLAGGIAHDFNNLLAGIYGNIDLARSISKDAQAIEYLNATLSTMNRARALTLQLLTFSKGGAPVQKSTLLIPFVCDAVRFALSGSNISSRFSLPENLWPCNIDKNQIIQVIENIVINAQQAMPNGGEIEISAMNVEASDYPRKAKGNYVKVSIKDFGIGIPKDIMPRIFDPFYTTKTKGHGLGLATCYSIINRHGGCIEVESEPGKGSAFHVYLPASMLPVVADERICVDNGGAGAIIVVDDEEVIRITVKRMLELKGYTAICKNDGKEAIDFFIRETKEHHRFAAMIFDLTIPGGMGGVDAVREIRAIDKEIPVFVASGYADNSVMKNPIEYGFTASICKPFTIAELSEMLGNYIKKGHPVK